VAEWRIEPFAADHERGAFTCGQPALNDFIRSRVRQYERRRIGKTLVAVIPGSKTVVGYYTIAAGAVSFSNMPFYSARKLPRHPVPVVLLARLAVDLSVQGMKLGEALLLDALQRTLDLSTSLGIHAVETHAINDAAAAFYSKYGFAPLPDDARHLFLPVSTISKLLA
jgi:GNAT superfamily N-acetyltransferase